MAQWSIMGADKKSGRDATLLVEAPSPELARQVAKERGLVVSAVKPAQAEEPARPAIEIAASAPSPAAVLNYLQKSKVAATPTLSALLWTSRVWFALAMMAYALGLATIAVNAMLRSIAAYNLFSVLRDAMTNLIIGAVFHLVSTLLLVLRDRLTPPGGDPA